jgi:hypothetical protein
MRSAMIVGKLISAVTFAALPAIAEDSPTSAAATADDRDAAQYYG